MIRGAIFDVDGTLLDSMYIWNDIGADYLRTLGIEPQEDLAETFKTMTMEQAARYYQEHYGVQHTVQEIAEGVNQMVEAFYRNTVQLRPGVKELLQRLQAEGVQMSVATATDRYLVEAALERCGVLSYFSCLFTCTEVGASKERPDIYEAARKQMGTKKEETWVFEDAFHAAETAAKAGFPVLGIADPSENRQEELRNVSQVYLESFQQAQAFWDAAAPGEETRR